jgi:hypothetical protein
VILERHGAVSRRVDVVASAETRATHLVDLDEEVDEEEPECQDSIPGSKSSILDQRASYIKKKKKKYSNEISQRVPFYHRPSEPWNSVTYSVLPQMRIF